MSDQLRGVAGCVGTGGKAPICESGNFFFFELTLVDDRWHKQSPFKTDDSHIPRVTGSIRKGGF